MNTGTLWQNIMNYGTFDRMPVLHWASWPETRARWEREGMPADADEHTYFSVDPHLYFVQINLGLYPAFREETLEETSEYRIFMDTDGVIQKELKKHRSVPRYIEYTLKTPEDWETYKKKLQPDPGRIPADLDDKISKAQSSGQPITFVTGSLMGWIREWMVLKTCAS